MADYYAILKRAVEAVPTQTREQRQTIYDKARKALLAKLQNMDPPLTPADISKQRMALEEAVRAVERDLSGSGMSLAPAHHDTDDEAHVRADQHPHEAPKVGASHKPKSDRPNDDERDAGEASDERAKPQKPHQGERPDTKERPKQEILEKKSPSDKVVRRAGQDVLKNAVRDANALGQATNKAVKHAQDAADAVGEERDSGEAARIEPTLGDAVVSQSKTYKRPSIEEGVSDRPSYASDDSADDDGSKSRFGLIAIAMLIVVVLIGSGYLLYANRDAFLLSDTTDTEQAANGFAQSVGKTQPGDTGSSSNSSDMAAKSVRTITVTPPSEEDGAAQDDDATAQAGTTTADATAPAVEDANNGASSGPADLSVAQRSILYEEPGGEGEPGSASAGEVLWSLDGEGDNAVVVIDATIPDKKMSFNITMKKNLDAELPASHLIEISATHADADPAKAIVKIPGLILKPTEQSRGEGLVGAAIRIADDLHWVALTSGDREERYNLELLHLRGWIDIPIQYETGRRAILTLEKGEAGDQVITKAIQAWSSR
ncbi:hypothetical protein SAMN04488056_10789 [Cohaesibacter marisflavi]|uniref:Uncharacterized protein n=1 Tax=Cohaesibacter marisflavi TaxID=655353 RepID=A0A1I5HS33_9HYPH|nr:hypothetical protein [Cohaesibacter marisflavi]SFO50949.1 hypothetical protein SAMN04488056_10789 [Cohaesibacter marisflavi]